MPLMKVGQNYWILKDYIMKIKIHELAAQEFGEAIEWYELQSVRMPEYMQIDL